MIYNILLIAAVILAAAALIISLYNHCIIKEDIEGFRKEINTLEAAQEETERLSSSNDCTNLIMKMFEMKRRPTTKQLEIAEQWRSANYPHELIHLAYEKTIEQIERLSFEYINSILVAWDANGYKTEDDVKRSEDEYKKNKKQSTPENSGKSGSESFDADKYSFVINNI